MNKNLSLLINPLHANAISCFMQNSSSGKAPLRHVQNNKDLNARENSKLFPSNDLIKWNVALNLSVKTEYTGQ